MIHDATSEATIQTAAMLVTACRTQRVAAVIDSNVIASSTPTSAAAAAA
jgi:hypothetical protein